LSGSATPIGSNIRLPFPKAADIRHHRRRGILLSKRAALASVADALRAEQARDLTRARFGNTKVIVRDVMRNGPSQQPICSPFKIWE
jgi:hypothetical protein